MTSEPTFVVIAAVSPGGVIGRDGDLAWRHPEDMRHLRALTMGHTLVMGRKNFEAIGRPLPGRRTVVITRQRGWAHEGVTVVHDTGKGLERALRAIVRESGDPLVFVFGGGEIYASLMDRAATLELTEIGEDLAGDVFFPAWDKNEWTETAREQRDGFAWVTYRRQLGN